MTATMLVSVGMLAGVHAATWGAYKDLPFEGFRLASYLRSVVVAAAASGFAAAYLAGERSAGAVLVTVGVVYAAERLATECWKLFAREDRRDGFTIPMRWAVRGRVVRSRAYRYAAGAAVATALAGGGWLLAALDQVAGAVPSWLLVLTAGGAGGWATAVGGAWKDAPVEGFSGWKFLRSPAVATGWALPLSLVTRDWLTLCLAAAGYAVASIETYKTFLTGGRPPGKFAGRPVRHYAPTLRRVFAAVHVVLWSALAAVAVGTLVEVPRGVGSALVGRVDPGLTVVVLAAPATGAALLALLVSSRTLSAARWTSSGGIP